MSTTQVESRLTEELRRKVFLALVEAQDHQMSVFASRRLIAQRFHLPLRVVLEIEEEGIDNGWPPL